MVFPAPCPACGARGKFIEFKVEACTPGSEVVSQYGFRCMACKGILPEVVDDAGARHAWVEGKHVEA